jgi:phosphatidylserine decarboxylase
MVVAMIMLLYFYRLPDRKSPDTGIVSPADGVIGKITSNKDGQKTIVIFLSPLDVHTQFVPVDGVVIEQTYKKGEFHPAYLFEKSDLNESNTIKIRTNDNHIVTVKQIAGLVARRIVSKVNVGDNLVKGKVYGMIKLSSRVDITLPKTARLQVKVGDRLYGAETIIAT